MSKLRIAIAVTSVAAMAFGVYGLLWAPEPGAPSTSVGSYMDNR